MSQQDYKTLRVPDGAWEDAKAQKEAAGRTWGEQIVRPDGDDGDMAAHRTEIEAAIGAVCGDAATTEDVRHLAELVEAIPERTAEELEDRFR